MKLSKSKRLNIPPTTNAEKAASAKRFIICRGPDGSQSQDERATESCKETAITGKGALRVHTTLPLSGWS